MNLPRNRRPQLLSIQRFAPTRLTWVLVLGGAMGAAGCSDGGGSNGTTGGAPAVGGASGGMGSGGTASGGVASGGAATGGASSGGAATGGAGAAEVGGSGGSGAGGSGGATVEALPELLSETGLYADIAADQIAADVQPFAPQFTLWTDTATKMRWIHLPEGQQIDTTDMDNWTYPVGTKLWKEFERDGVRVETRLLQRQFNGVWVMMAYQWRDDLSDADAVPLGVENASGTAHDIPSEEQCWGCHNQMPGRVLGFSAIQLAHDAGVGIPGEPEDSEWTLDDLQSEGWLTDEPPEIALPGDEIELAAAGYLHANCGHCHHPTSSVSRVDMELRLTVEGVAGPFEETPIYQTTVGELLQLPSDGPEGATHRIQPDDLVASGVYGRFTSLGAPYSMPPLGTEIIDPAGEEALRLWIESLVP